MSEGSSALELDYGRVLEKAWANAGPHNWTLEMLGMTEGYDRASGRGVRVAVLDTGVDLAHPDFEGRFREGENAVSFVPGESVQDGHGHGTHCVGILAAKRRPDRGPRFCVAPDAEVLVAKVLPDNRVARDECIFAGIAWALAQKARIIALPFGASRALNAPYAERFENIAVQAHAEDEGVLFLAAAGNFSRRPAHRAPLCDPAACPSYLAVTAVDHEGAVWPRACAGLDGAGGPCLGAPGETVRSTMAGGGYCTLSGTSMAVPHVAGVAALVLEHAPGLDWRTLRRKLVESALPLGDAPDYGAGLVQAP